MATVASAQQPIQPAAPKEVVSSRSATHSIKAAQTIPVEVLQQYLSRKGSPLAPYSADILQSPYWSTIIGICTIEQYGCTKAPNNNYWGLGPGKRFATPAEGIAAISAFLAKADSSGHDTIEKLNGWYNQPGSSNWLSTVTKTKLKLETLN